MHDGDPRILRQNPPYGLGDLHLSDVLSSVRAGLRDRGQPIMIGHSVGGLITQMMLNERLISAGVAIDPVAPNGMIDLDWGFIKNSTIIANPLKGNGPIFMDAKTFHSAFANTLRRRLRANSRGRQPTTVAMSCAVAWGRTDASTPTHGPLLLIGGEHDQIIPAHLTEKNFKAYTDERPKPTRPFFAQSEIAQRPL